MEDFLFTKSQPTYRNHIKRIAKKSKVKKDRLYPHSFRHFFAKQFINGGGDATTLQQLLGHSQIQTTTIYTKMNDDELEKVYRKQNNK